MMSMLPSIGGSADESTRVRDVRSAETYGSGRAPWESIDSGLRGLLTVLLVVHGGGHLLGTDTALSAVKQQMSTTFQTRGSTSVDYLVGHWELSYQPTLLLIALCWTVLAVGFLVVASRVWHRRPGWWALLTSVTAASLVLSLIALPQTAIGAVIDASLLMALLWATPCRYIAIASRPVLESARFG